MGDSCTACGAPVRVVITEQGRRLELDPDPTVDGTVVPVEVGGRALAHVLTGGELPAETPAWQRHTKTCPEGPDARRRRARAAPRCRVCTGALDANLAAAEDHDTHPACDDRAAAELVRHAARHPRAPEAS